MKKLLMFLIGSFMLASPALMLAATPPDASTYPPDPLPFACRFAGFRGALVDDGGAPCQYRFHYWSENSPLMMTDWKPVGAPPSGIISEQVGRLMPGTHYAYRLEVRNEAGSSLGDIRSVKTLPLVKTKGIVYVDATEGAGGNTTLATGEVFTSTEDGSGSDNLWRGRTFANNGTIFESGGQFGDTANPEDCPRLCTRVDVDIPGCENEYAVYAYFWADGSTWRMQASLTNDANDLPLYFANDPESEATQAVADDFQEPVPLLAEGNRTLWQVFLGYTAPTSTITVYIDDDPNHQTHNGRTWYDGIGYQVAPPRIHYVDATDGESGNTTLATGETLVAPDPGTAGSGADGLWRGRMFANEGTIFESGGSWEADLNTEDCPRLVTSVDVPEDVYQVYAYFWADAAQWRIQASLTNDDNDLPLYLANDPNSEATLANPLDFELPVPLVAEGNRTLWQVFLGYTDLTTTITVYIDDDPNHITGNARTWYDGIGYKIAPPRIIYVDATDASDPNVPANTTLVTGEALVAPDPGTAGSGADGLWRGRVFANEGTIFESGGSWEADLNTEDCPRLVTSIDVPEGNYDVFVYFWADAASWRIQASLTNDDNDLPLYLANDPNSEATLANALDFESPVPLLAEDNRMMWQAYLGQTGTTTAISVYIDDDPNHITGNARTWYDGIGYKPED